MELTIYNLKISSVITIRVMSARSCFFQIHRLDENKWSGLQYFDENVWQLQRLRLKGNRKMNFIGSGTEGQHLRKEGKYEDEEEG